MRFWLILAVFRPPNPHFLTIWLHIHTVCSFYGFITYKIGPIEKYWDLAILWPVLGLNRGAGRRRGGGFLAITRPFLDENQLIYIPKWSSLQAGSDAIKIKALRPSYKNFIFWATLVPPSATGAAYGLRAQIFSQKLPLGIPFMYNQYLESHSAEKSTPETPSLILKCTWRNGLRL